MRSSPTLVLVTLVLFTALIGSIFFWVNVLQRDRVVGTDNQATDNIQQNSDPACQEFQSQDVKISCEKAISLALQNFPGDIVEIEPITEDPKAPEILWQTKEDLSWNIRLQLIRPVEYNGEMFVGTMFLVVNAFQDIVFPYRSTLENNEV